MNYTQFFSDVKAGKLKNLYLLHGDEEYIKEEALKALISAAVPDMQDLNVSVFENPTLDDVFAACEAISFLGGMRVVVIKSLFKEQEAKALAKYFDELPSSVILVIYLRGTADARSIIVKKAKELNAIVEFNILSEGDAIKWVEQQAKKANCPIGKDTARFFVATVGKDMLSIKNELFKLLSYANGREITKEMVSHVVISNVEYKIYVMYDYFAAGNFREGFRALDSLMSGKNVEEEAIGIAGYFVRCLKNTLYAHDALKKGLSAADIAAHLKISEWSVKSVCANARRFTKEQLLDGILAFSNVLTKRITGAATAPQALNDAILSTFSGKATS
jgi:DNA polymerase-3 subunit delta